MSTTERIKPGGEEIVRTLSKLSVPEDLHNCVHKNGRSHRSYPCLTKATRGSVRSNYITIDQPDQSPSKVILKVIQNRLTPAAEEIFAEKQACTITLYNIRRHSIAYGTRG